MKTIIIPEPGKVEIIETPMPEPKPGEALLKVLCGGICGSDLGTYRGTFAYASYLPILASQVTSSPLKSSRSMAPLIP